MAESKMVEFKMAAHHEVEWEWMNEVFLLFKMAQSKMTEFKMGCLLQINQIELV